jgi:hypothetical protein
MSVKNTNPKYIIHYNIWKFLWNLEELNMVKCYLYLLCVFTYMYVHITFVIIWCVSVYCDVFV